MNGDLVRKWMVEQKLRPEQLATKLDVSLSTIQNMLSGKKVYGSTIRLFSYLSGIPENDLKGLPRPVTRHHKKVAMGAN